MSVLTSNHPQCTLSGCLLLDIVNCTMCRLPKLDAATPFAGRSAGLWDFSSYIDHNGYGPAFSLHLQESVGGGPQASSFSFARSNWSAILSISSLSHSERM